MTAPADGNDRRAWLRGDPMACLLDPSTPAVRQLALRHLLRRRADDPEAGSARRAAMASGPVASIRPTGDLPPPQPE